MANQRQSLYLFGSLEVHRTAYSGSTYTIDDKTLVPYAMSNGVRLARLHYENAVTVPQVAGTGLTDALGKTNTAATLHVLLELGDHLGSTGTVLDKVSSELVERTGYLPFGARENDYRPSRWSGFREDYGFTGKEEDVQVGLVYFGKRYLSPQLGRWLSPDPLAVHAPGRADFNLYAYVSGAVLKAVDPLGLDAAWIVFKGADEFHDAALARATNWAKEGSGRHVVVVSASPRQETMDKAWSDAAAKAGEGGKVILTGHGAAYEDGQSSWVLQLAAAKRDATQNPYRVTADELNPDKGHGIKATSSEKIDQYFANASEQLSKHGVRDVEVFACNIGKNEKQIADLARRFQTRTTAYKAFVGVDDAGQSTGLSREEHGPSIKGSESKGLPSETEAGVGYTEVYDPIPELTGQAAGAAAYEASMKVHGE